MQQAQREACPRMTATYSPEDNKLRLYTVSRLDADTYAKVKVQGFKWAPKQDLFVAPMWTPERAALLVELCGEIDDEDRSLVERAEERAERFEEYSDKREADAHAARANVERITSGIPMGQPILVGHHSEKHARKDAERIERGMQKAVNMWETAQYWERRAAGAIRHAKYKEIPGVRHRRIKGLEADKRKQEKEITISEGFAKMWAKAETVEQARKIANFDNIRMPAAPDRPYGESVWGALDKGTITAPDAAALALAQHGRSVERARTWLAHINNRIAYERAMLGESGGLAADRFPIEAGGRVTVSGWQSRKGWIVVLRVTRKDGAISSVRTTEGLIGVEEITDYRAPEGDDAAKVKAATKLAPLVNYPGEGFRHMLKADYDKRAKVSDFCCVRRVAANEKHGAHRRREAPKEGGQYWDRVGVYLTDAKRVDPPAPETTPPRTADLAPEPGPPPELRARVRKEPTAFDDMKASLKAGVAVVSAPQLFPTPPELAARMVREAGIERHHRVLEPSAGTGVILREVYRAGAESVAVEIVDKIAKALRAQYPLPLMKGTPKIMCGDFLSWCADDLGGHFDRVVMNPPFANGADVEHVTHAFRLLKPGGRLVAIMSAGVEFRQDRRTRSFRKLVEECGGTIEKLPPKTFEASGTGVNTVLVTMEASS